jgi:hypothetical protein
VQTARSAPRTFTLVGQGTDNFTRIGHWLPGNFIVDDASARLTGMGIEQSSEGGGGGRKKGGAGGSRGAAKKCKKIKDKAKRKKCLKKQKKQGEQGGARAVRISPR